MNNNKVNDNQIPEQFIISIEGKPYVLYAGLLHVASEQSLRELSVTINQIPSEENGYLAIMQAKAITNTGATFIDFGDANPASVGDDTIVPHLIRVASTRAKARVLRDAYAITMTSLEELSLSKTTNGTNPPPKPAPTVTPVPKENPTEEPMTTKQKHVLESLARQLHFGRNDYLNHKISSLTKADASRKIDELSNLVKTNRLNLKHPQENIG